MNREYDLFLSWDASKGTKIFAVIDDELYFRLNPHWIIDSFSSSSGGYSVQITDHATDQSISLEGTISCNSDGFPRITSDGDEWQAISFCEKNGNLHAEVSYTDAPSEEVEKQLVFWLRSIKEYLRLYATNTINTRFFRMLMNRVILKMTPSQRKISLMLIRITMLEILVILIILVGWFVFR
jgi:hypothetical protein